VIVPQPVAMAGHLLPTAKEHVAIPIPNAPVSGHRAINMEVMSFPECLSQPFP
jgi:hypothetical protein